MSKYAYVYIFRSKKFTVVEVKRIFEIKNDNERCAIDTNNIQSTKKYALVDGKFMDRVNVFFTADTQKGIEEKVKAEKEKGTRTVRIPSKKSLDASERIPVRKYIVNEEATSDKLSEGTDRKVKATVHKSRGDRIVKEALKKSVVPADQNPKGGSKHKKASEKRKVPLSPLPSPHDSSESDASEGSIHSFREELLGKRKSSTPKKGDIKPKRMKRTLDDSVRSNKSEKEINESIPLPSEANPTEEMKLNVSDLKETSTALEKKKTDYQNKCIADLSNKYESEIKSLKDEIKKLNQENVDLKAKVLQLSKSDNDARINDIQANVKRLCTVLLLDAEEAEKVIVKPTGTSSTSLKCKINNLVNAVSDDPPKAVPATEVYVGKVDGQHKYISKESLAKIDSKEKKSFETRLLKVSELVLGDLSMWGRRPGGAKKGIEDEHVEAIKNLMKAMNWKRISVNPIKINGKEYPAFSDEHIKRAISKLTYKLKDQGDGHSNKGDKQKPDGALGKEFGKNIDDDGEEGDEATNKKDDEQTKEQKSKKTDEEKKEDNRNEEEDHPKNQKEEGTEENNGGLDAAENSAINEEDLSLISIPSFHAEGDA